MHYLKNFIYNFSFHCFSLVVSFQIKITNNVYKNLKTTMAQETLFNVLLSSVEHQQCEKPLHYSTTTSDFFSNKGKDDCMKYI